MSGDGPDLAIFVSYSGEGGVEQVINLLLRGLTARGCRVDLLLIKARGRHLKAFPPGVNVIRLEADHTLTALPALIHYLRRRRPPVLMAVRHRAIKAAVLARAIARTPTRIVGQIHTTASAALDSGKPLKKRLWLRQTRRYYGMTELMIGVSEGVADDIRRMAQLPAERVTAIYNPIITPELSQLAAEPVDHPWFTEHDRPVIISAGRLTRQKDFPTLLRAFATLRAKRPCRLVILGEGKDRAKLEALADELGIAADVALPGHVDNPFAWMAAADLFVLSSIWEGFGNVLAEALAVGTPVVATDCPSGPREILRDGRLGPLVTPGDADALASAMAETLDHPPRIDDLEAALGAFTIDAAADNYARTLGLKCRDRGLS